MKSTKARGKGLHSEISRLSRKLKEPRVYFSGIEAPASIYPRSILVFGRRTGASLDAPSEQHHRFVAIVAIEGKGSICVDERIHRMKPGDAVLICPFQSHSYLNVDSRIQWIFFAFEHSENVHLEGLRDRGPVALGSEEFGHIAAMLQSWFDSSRTHRLPLQLGLFLHCLSDSASSLPRVKRQVSDSPDEELIAKINLYATQHLASPFTLATLAQLVGVSASHLRSRFHQITGRSLGRHLRELRMQHACSLLHDGRSSIGDIAQQCGFDSLFSFSRAFRNSIGCAPTAYRALVSKPHHTSPPGE